MRWVEGETVSRDRVRDLNTFSLDLARFLKDLQAIDTFDAPLAGKHNFYRGGPLSVYDKETRNTITLIQDYFDKNLLLEIWQKALKSSWLREPVWVHGDMAPGNILVNDQGELSGIIDFGIMGVGDPACDLVIAWTFLDQGSRELFKKVISLDRGTWDRARGWALWKAVISYDEYMKANHPLREEIARVIEIIMEEYTGVKGLDK